MPVIDDHHRDDLLGDRYRLHELLGEDGAGALYRATDELLGRVVAVRRIRLADLTAREADIARKRTVQQARIVASLRHPHVVTVFDVLTVGADPWLILEYVPSRTLSDVVEGHGPVNPEEVAAIGVQLADALAAAHAIGIVHRDVKPANVLIVERCDPTAPPVVGLTGFGFAHADDAPQLTETGIVTGTPAFSAPETARGEGTDSRSDVYSLGATLYAAVEGAPPFGDDEGNVLALIARIARGGVPEPHRAGTLAPILLAMTADDPRSRPTALQARLALSRVHPSAAVERTRTDLAVPPPAGGSGTVPPPPVAPSTSRWPRRRRVVLVALLLVAVIALIGPILHLVSPAAAPSTQGPTSDTPLPDVDAITIPDPRTADPCSLLELSAVAPFGTPRLDPAGHLSECRVVFTSEETGGGAVEVRFVAPLRAGQPLGGAQEQLGQLTLARYEAEEDRCRRFLLLSDRHLIGISARPFGDGPSADLCAVADAATRSVVERLATAGIGTGPPRAVTSSLGTVDACGLLRPEQLALVPGLVATPVPGFGGWQCDWGDDDGTDASTVVIQFVIRPAFRADEGEPADVGGPEARYATRGDGSCLTQVRHRAFAGPGGEELIEAVGVYVRGPGPADQRCRLSVALGASVAANLPPG